MRKAKRFTAILLAAVLLGGCGSEGVSQEEYDKVVAERDELQEENERLQRNYDTAVEELASLQASITIDEIKGESGVEKETAGTEGESKNSADSEGGSDGFPFDYYPSGQYKVGSDIDSGEYVLLAEDDKGGFFSVNSDANGNDIIFNGSFETNSIVSVNDGEFLVVKRGIAVRYDDFYPNYSIKLEKEGIMIKVGNEIQEGEYKIEGENGFYSIYSDSRQSDIISNGSIDGSGYINVKNGQYLALKRCKISEKTE